MVIVLKGRFLEVFSGTEGVYETISLFSNSCTFDLHFFKFFSPSKYFSP